MNCKRILITGGAGFVGANLGLAFKAHFDGVEVSALDNLKRRGSELNVRRLATAGVQFIHGDVRNREDLDACPPFDLLIDCAAEPSVQAGLSGSPLPVIQHNLAGTINCMESARRHDAAFILLSTSRVYPIARLNELPFREEPTRFSWTADDLPRGVTADGITEDFPLEGARSVYGATKLAAELLLQEYAYSYQMPALINRCGLLAGPWQMGKVDQGVVTLWAARHVFGIPLKYIGFGGDGKQVRDVLHVDDLFDLLVRQLDAVSRWRGEVYNVGGGRAISASLLELTRHCRDVIGRTVPIRPEPATSPVDIRIYLTDHRRATRAFDWRPRRPVAAIVEDIARWVRANEEALRPLLT
jgi:CDP-paratose 2-epimerase